MSVLTIVATNPATGGGGGGGGALALAFANSTVPVGVSLSGCALVATGGAGGYVYALPGFTLPSWLSFNVSTGIFSGTPPTPNVSYPFTGKVTDAASTVVSRSYTLTVTNQLTLRCNAVGTSGVALSGCGLYATGGVAPYTFAVASGSISPYSLNTSTGALTGTGGPGFYFFTGQVTDSAGNVATDATFIWVSPNFSTFPSGTINLGGPSTMATYGVYYTSALVATLGAGGYSFSITSGALPTGLTLNGVTGQIVGTPSAVGTFTFTAKVVDSASGTVSVSFTIVVSAATTPGGSTLGAETPNCTPLNWTGQLVPGNNVDGGSSFQCILSNVVSPDSPLYSGGIKSQFYYADLIICPVVTVGTTFTSTGSSQSITVAPFASASAYNGFNDPSVSGSIPCIFHIDAEQFLLTVKGGSGAWTVTGGQNGTTPATHSAGALVVGLQGCASLNMGAVQNANGATYPVGAPSQYPPLQTTTTGITDTYATISFIAYLVSVSKGGNLNTYPVPGETPYAGPFTLPYPSGTLSATRIAPESIGPGLDGGGGSILQSTTITTSALPNFNFSFGSNGWTTLAGSPTFVSGSSFAQTGSTYLQLNLGSKVNGTMIPCRPGDTWTGVAAWRDNGSVGAYTGQFYVLFYDSSMTLLGPPYPEENTATGTGSWQSVAVVGVAPSNASFVSVQLYYPSGGPGGSWWGVDNVYLLQSLTGQGLGLDPFGNLVSTAGNMNNMVYNAGLEALPPGVDWTLTNAVLLTGQVASGNGGTTGSHSGSCCAQLLANTSTPSNSATAKLQQGPSNAGIYSCFPGEIYTLNVWYRGGTGTDYWQFYINWFDTLGAAFNITSPDYGPQSGWTQPNGGFGYTFTIPAVSGSIAASSFNILVRAPGGTTNSFYFDDFTLTQAPATTGAIEIDANGNANIAAQGVQNAMIAAGAVQAAQTALAAINAATGAIANGAIDLATMFASSGNYIPVQAIATLYTQSITTGNALVTGLLTSEAITVACQITTGSLQSTQGSSFVGINAIGHAIVASNSATGATTDLDDGYLTTFITLYQTQFGALQANNFAAYLGQQTFYGGVQGFSFEVSDSIPIVISGIGYGTSQSIAQTIVNTLLSALIISYELPGGIPGGGAAINTYIELVSGAQGTFLSMSASATPPPLPGSIYYDGTHFYFCVGASWVQVGP